MTSQINPNNIDGTYPVAGQPNNTQGFRDNFTNIKTNFSTAKAEITDLENNGVFKAALSGTVLDNNMSDNLIYAVKLNDLSYTALQQTITAGSITLDYSAAQYQTVVPSANVSFGFSNWPASGSAGEMFVDITITNTAYTVQLPGAVSLGITGIQGLVPTYNISSPYNLSYSIITFGATGTYRFGFSSVDNGTTITIYDLNRALSYYTNPVTITANANSTSTTTGALIVGGGAAIAGNLYVGGDIFGNVSITDLNLGNVTASGYMSATGNITSAANITGANILTTGLVSAAANIQSAGYFIGDGGYLSNITAYGNIVVTEIANGTSSLRVTGISSNITAEIGGTSNVVVWATTGEYITGVVSATGNITGGNLRTAGLISATGNITGGNLIGAVSSTTISASGNITGGNLLTAGLISSTGTITASSHLGAVVSVTANVTGGNLITGGLASVAGNIQVANMRTVGLVTATGNIVGGNINTAGNVSLAGNVIAGNLTTGGSVVGNVLNGSYELIGPGVSANFTRFPNALAVISTTASGIQQNEPHNIGLMAEGVANSANSSVYGVGVYGVGYTNSGTRSSGVTGEGHVSASADTGSAVGVRGYSNDTHASGLNIGLYGEASGSGTGNYALYMANGNIYSSVAQSWTLLDNDASALTVDATGKTGIIKVITTNSAEGVGMSGFASVTGNVTGGNILTAGLISAGGTLTVGGDTTLSGNLTVNGNITYINSNVITTNEKSITLANNQSTAANVDGSGVDIGNTTIAYWRFNNATTSWQSNIGLTPAANATLNLGGTSNYWAAAYLTSATVSGNVVGGNILTGGVVSSTGNITGSNILTAGLISATGNITGGNVSVGANVNAGNVLTGGVVSATGNITGGNISTAGAFATASVSASGNITGGNILTGGLVSATSTITSSANITGGNMLTVGLISATSTITSSANVAGGNILTGGLISATANVTAGNVTTAGLVSATGNVITAGAVLAQSSTAIPAGGAAGAGYTLSSTVNFGVFFGSGVPTLSAAKGSLYLRSDGSTTNDRMYVNTNGTTGWTAVITAS